MARLVKFLLILIAAVFGIGIIASVALFLFFNPNDFREDISAGVKEATGRELVIEGDLSLSIFPWIAVEVGSTRLGNAEGFGDQPFLSFEQARLSVRLLPLIFRQEVAIGNASLDSLNVNLAVNGNGVSNWDDLAEAGAGDAGTATSSGDPDAEPTKFEVGGISVTNAGISYTDQQAGSSTSISGLSFQSSSIGAGEPFDVDAEFNFDSSPGNVGGQLSIGGTIVLSEGMSEIDIDRLNITGTLRGVAEEPTDFSFDSRAINVDTAKQRVSLGEMDLGILGVSLSADVETFSYAGDPQPSMSLRVHEFSLKQLMQTLGSEAPATLDPNALQRVSFSANAAVGPASVALSEMQLSLDDTTMVGSLALPKTAGGTMIFDLKVDSIVLDSYMAPASEDGASSADTGDTNVEIPVDLIRAVNARGNFSMDQATLSGIVFENLQLGLDSEQGRMRLHPIAATLFEGRYDGDVNINVIGDRPELAVNENIIDVQLSSLANAMYGVENVSGTINGKFVLRGRGADLNEIRQNLQGDISFELADGEFQGTDVWYQIRRARALFKQQPPPQPRLPARTEFSSVSASGKVIQGVMDSRDLLAELPFIRLTGAGKVNFVDATVDYVMDARVLDKPELAGEVGEDELQDYTSFAIPVKVSGPLASPSISPDFEALIKQEIDKKKDEIKDRLIDKLLGGDEEAAEGIEEGDNQEEPDAEEQIKDALKDLLGG